MRFRSHGDIDGPGLPSARWRAVGDATRSEMHRAVVSVLDAALPPERGRLRLLDIGCHDGLKTVRIADELGIARENIVGLELLDPLRVAASELFEVRKADFESGDLPVDDEEFDVVVCDQVLEHLKNVHVMLDDIHRVTKTGGLAMVGIPNLAALHNRLLLALGRQPTSVGVMTSHVRGFTLGSMRQLLEFGGRMEVEHVAGHGLYPLRPSNLVTFVVRRVPGAAPYVFLAARKQHADGPTLVEWLQANGKIAPTDAGWVFC